MATVARQEGRSSHWKWVGALGVLCGLLILSFYSVVAGWTLEYFRLALAGELNGLTTESAVALLEGSNGLLASGRDQLIWHSVFMIITILIISQGVNKGLELAVKTLMPVLFVLLIGLAVFAATLPGASEGWNYLLNPDFSSINGGVVLAAMGQAFFSLSLGMGALMAYGAYLPKNISIPRTAGFVALIDTSVALLAGLALFPIIFSFGLEPGRGPGLVFVTLPLAFSQAEFGQWLAALFFLLLFIAALTSALSLLEPATAWLVEKTGMQRFDIALLLGLVVWLLGVPSALSYNVLSEVLIFGKPILDNVDRLTTNFMLPLGGMLIAIFVGWRISLHSLQQELAGFGGKLFVAWLWLLRILAPLAIGMVFLQAIGVFGKAG